MDPALALFVFLVLALCGFAFVSLLFASIRSSQISHDQKNNQENKKEND